MRRVQEMLFPLSEACPFDYCKTKSCSHHNSLTVIYLHETLLECVSGQDKVLRKVMVAFLFLCPPPFIMGGI